MVKFLAAARRVALDILTSGTFDQYQIEKRSRIIFQNAATLAGAAFIGLFGFINIFAGNWTLVVVDAIISSVIVGNFLFIRLSKNFAAGGWIDVSLIFFYFLYLLWSGGEENSGYLWSMIYPLIAIFLLGGPKGTVMSLSYGACAAAILFVPAIGGAHFSFQYGVRIIGTFIFIWLFGIVYENVRSATQRRLTESNADLVLVTGELSAEKKQTDNIMHNVQEGIFVLDRSFRIGNAYSAHLENIFEKKELGGLFLADVLTGMLDDKDLKATRDYFDVFYSDKVNHELLSEINPLAEVRCEYFLPDGSTREKWLRFAFARITDAEGGEALLGVVRDASGEVLLRRRLEQETREHRRIMESLFQIIHVDPGMMKEFIADTEEELEAVNALLKEEGVDIKVILVALFQSVHAVKGNALILGLNEFGFRVHDFEDRVKERLDGGCEWRDLLKLTLGLGELRKELEELKQLIGKILAFQVSSKDMGLGDASLLEHSIVRLAAREAERKDRTVSVGMSGFDSFKVPDRHRKLVKDSLVQLVRNSLAHGFEAPTDREKVGKEAAGRISVSIEREGGKYTLRYRDDGRGLDLDKIRQKAACMPEHAGRELEPNDLVKLIFQPGFSTTEVADMASGRGVGMSLIKQRVEEAGGRIAIKSSAGKFFELAITLPLPENAAVA